MNPSDDASRAAHLHLRSHYSGELLLADRVAKLSYIRHPARGTLIAPLEPWAFDDSEATLSIPDSAADSLQLHVSFVRVDPDREPACDRWLAYHLAAGHRSWAELTILGGRLNDAIIDAEHLSIPNTCRSDEPAACKRANADRPSLRRICETASHRELPDALCVAVDQLGIDLRTTFGPVRLDVESPREIRFDIWDKISLTPGSGPEFILAIEAARQSNWP